MKYFSEVTNEFYDSEAALRKAETEHQLAKIEVERAQKKAEERERRLKEVEEAERHYRELLKKYTTDYNDPAAMFVRHMLGV
jgi:DNA-binding protein H-NS